MQAATILFLLFCVICGIIIDARKSDSLKDTFLHSAPIAAALFVSLYAVGIIEDFYAAPGLAKLILDPESIAIYALISIVSLLVIMVASLARSQLLNLWQNAISAREETRENVKLLIKIVSVFALVMVSGSVTEIRELVSILYGG